jgi:poly(hydroxyalkanoate) depolymerase family esterase
MKHDFASAMRRATQLVRAGNPAAATKMIQATLGTSGLSKLKVPETGTSTAHRSTIGRSLRNTLAGLAARSHRPGSKGPGSRGENATDPALPDGARFDSGTFTCAAGSRDYRLYIPDLKGARPAGLIMMLHGCTQSPVDFAKGTGMNQLADAHGLIIAYPAQSRGANMQSCWNWFAPTDQMANAGEPAILSGLARQIQQSHSIPAGRSFVAGLSAGAAMAVILGRTCPETFAAVGAHSGLPYKSAHDIPSAFAAMKAGGPTSSNGAAHPTIVFHGDADRMVNAANGQRIAVDAAIAGPQLLEDGTTAGRSFTRSTTLAPSGGSVSEHWIIAGLGHAWSGGQQEGSYTDPQGPNASAEMVRFFLDLPVKGA